MPLPQFLPKDINAEVLLAYYPKGACKISFSGLHKRNTYNDIVELEPFSDDAIHLTLSRNSLYNALPEYMFHPIDRFDNLPKVEEKEELPEAVDMYDEPLDFRVVEDLPQFPGGAVEFMKWLTKNLKYPATAQQRKVQGRVVAQFIVNQDGSVSDIQVVERLSTECDREALRVLRMMPKWQPGLMDAKPCRTKVCIPIVFKL